MPCVRLVPSSLEPFALAERMRDPGTGKTRPHMSLLRRQPSRSSGLNLGFSFGFTIALSRKIEERSTTAERRRPELMITEWVTFLKPCAFGAPQAASGLDQRHPLGEGVAVSSMPHCRVHQRRQIPALDKGRLI